MIYLFHGSDEAKARTKAFEWIAKAREKEPNLAYARLAREDLTDATLEQAALSGGLFVKRLLVLIDNPYQTVRGSDDEESAPATNLLDDHLDVLTASENAILILAPKLMAAKQKKLAGLAKAEYKYDKPAAVSGGRGFNSALVNALAFRSREKLWLEVERALRAGDAPEMLHGLLHWKARDLMDLPAGRQGRAAWTRDEARRLSLDLIELLQSSRRGGLSLPLALERFVLSV